MKSINLSRRSKSVRYLCSADERLAKAIRAVGKFSYAREDDPYAFLVHVIIEQMLSIAVGRKIYMRLDELSGGIKPENVANLTEEELRSVGMSSRKSGYILNTTDAVLKGELNFKKLERLMDDEVMKTLRSIKGIGPWTAKMYLIFVLDRQDVLPIEDLTFMQALKWLCGVNDMTAAEAKARCAAWSPYSSVAARYLYRAFDSGLTKTDINLLR